MLPIKPGCHVLSQHMYQYMPASQFWARNFPACQDLGYPSCFKHIIKHVKFCILYLGFIMQRFKHSNMLAEGKILSNSTEFRMHCF